MHTTWRWGGGIFFLLCLWSMAPSVSAQTETQGQEGFCVARVVDGDTIPMLQIRQVVIATKRRFRNRRDYYAYQRMIRNLKKVYPYAVLARERLKEIDSVHATLPNEMARRAYAHRMEKQLSAEFEDQLRNLTLSQGRMLLKLIDRETGRTTYTIVKYFRGGLMASFWQGVAKMFGSDIRAPFDPEGEDKLLNELVILLEEGML